MTRLMPLSKGCQYALRAVAYLATLPAGAVCSSRDLSRRTDIPRTYLSKILQHLTQCGILTSHRGYVRGYSLSRPAIRVNARDIVWAYEGPLGHEGCLLDEHRLCSGERVCPLHRLRMGIQKRLGKCLADICICELRNILPKRAGATRMAKGGS